MTNEPEKDSMIDDIKQLLVSFGLPVIIIIICALLLWSGIDGEVKSILAMAAGWIFKSGWETARGGK